MLRWLMVGDLMVRHRQKGQSYYPEDEHRVRGWRADGDTLLWAQAVLAPLKMVSMGAQMCLWLATNGYHVHMRTGNEWLVVLYQHPALEFELATVWADPICLR